MEFIIILVLILLNGLFSMSEISLVSARKFKLEKQAQKGSAKAARALKLSENPGLFLSTVQIGITLIGILTGIFSGQKITEDLTVWLTQYELTAGIAGTLASVIVVAVVTFLTILLGELIPKRIGLLFPDKIASMVAMPIHFLSVAATPVNWLLTKSGNVVLNMFGLRRPGKEKVTEEEVRALLEQSTRSGNILEIEQDIVERVFVLGDRKIKELMTYRNDVIWLDMKEDMHSVMKKVRSEPHSFYPVVDETLDNLRGVVTLKGILLELAKQETFSLPGIIQPALIVHENTAAYRVLEMFRERQTHHAMVVDEYGSVEGLVSMDDVLDAILGDISNRQDSEYKIIKRDDSSWLADGQYPYFEMLNYFNLVDMEDARGDFSTIGGLLLHLLGHIPATGEKISWQNLEFEVIDLDGSRIDKVLISRKEAEGLLD